MGAFYCPAWFKNRLTVAFPRQGDQFKKPSLLFLISKYLKAVGCKIEVAPDAKTALRILEEEKGEFDFIICDMRMPEMGGDDFYRVIEKGSPSLKEKIIFCTGDLSSGREDGFIESTKNPYIRKPFDMKELKEAVIRLTRKWGTKEEGR